MLLPVDTDVLDIDVLEIDAENTPSPGMATNLR